MHWSNNETEAHTISQTTITVRECYSHRSVWYVAQTCSQWCLSILLIQLEQKGTLATHWNKQRKPKGKCSRQGLGMVLLLPPALALRTAAVLLHLADASFCPAGQKERCWKAMDSWWKRLAKFLRSHMLGSQEDWIVLWAGVDVSTGEVKTALVSGCLLPGFYTLLFLPYLQADAVYKVTWLLLINKDADWRG